MKQIFKDKITNIDGTALFDQTFLFQTISEKQFPLDIEVVYMRDILEQKKNNEIIAKLTKHPAMWSEVYSPKDELEIFVDLFESSIKNNKKIHIVGITLGEEVKLLEDYYTTLGFVREDINAFDVDFSVPLVTASCYIENIMWRGSDYKRLGKKIFLNPPVREAGQVKALYKGINRGVIAGIEIGEITSEKNDFLRQELLHEHLLPLTLGKILKYNFEDLGCVGKNIDLTIRY